MSLDRNSTEWYKCQELLDVYPHLQLDESPSIECFTKQEMVPDNSSMLSLNLLMFDKSSIVKHGLYVDNEKNGCVVLLLVF